MFELILRCFNKLVEILMGSMHANTMYRDCVSVTVSVPWLQWLKLWGAKVDKKPNAIQRQKN